MKRIATVVLSVVMAGGFMTIAAGPVSADQPCSWREQKLYFYGERDANFGGSGIVTLLNCHPSRTSASIDVSRGFDPACKNIPFGGTREFEYNRLKGLASYNKPKWC
ncbi:hypothetical protein LFM09_39165 [Lentzea alba]|uniref:hypothetical protein n=1 Tax=Lentzea alba TaxID=2714351 RepID=UPI0039BFE9B7